MRHRRHENQYILSRTNDPRPLTPAMKDIIRTWCAYGNAYRYLYIRRIIFITCFSIFQALTMLSVVNHRPIISFAPGRHPFIALFAALLGTQNERTTKKPIKYHAYGRIICMSMTYKICRLVICFEHL